MSKRTKKVIIISLLTIGVLMTLWIVAGLWPSWGIEEPRYDVISKNDIYEVREYHAYILAQTKVSGSYSDATSQGFRIIAGYIFGDNVSKQKISMTAPVVQAPSLEKIAMTAPVVTQPTGSGEFKVAFIMPSQYTLASLPTPNDKRVELVEMPRRRIAVLRFSGYATSEKIAQQTEVLKQALDKDGLRAIRFESARYNPPWTPPFLMRNEIWAILAGFLEHPAKQD